MFIRCAAKITANRFIIERRPDALAVKSNVSGWRVLPIKKQDISVSFEIWVVFRPAPHFDAELQWLPAVLDQKRELPIVTRNVVRPDRGRVRFPSEGPFDQRIVGQVTVSVPVNPKARRLAVRF